MLARINTWDWPPDLGIASAMFSNTDSLHSLSSLKLCCFRDNLSLSCYYSMLLYTTECSEISFRHCIYKKWRLFEIPPCFWGALSSSDTEWSTIFKMRAHQLWMRQNSHPMTRTANLNSVPESINSYQKLTKWGSGLPNLVLATWPIKIRSHSTSKRLLYRICNDQPPWLKGS